jgi:hypothetical protein
MSAYSFKRRFVNPIRIGLGLIPIEPKIIDDPDSSSGYSLEAKVRPKRQTIRAEGKRRHARPGEIVQLYHGMRTKQCFKIGDGRCTSVALITMEIGTHTLFIRIDGEQIGSGYIHDFARADGFDHSEDMLAFWHAEHSDISNFKGVLIKWQPL